MTEEEFKVMVESAKDVVSVEPGLTSNGQPTSNVSLSINRNEITANSNYGFIIKRP